MQFHFLANSFSLLLKNRDRLDFALKNFLIANLLPLLQSLEVNRAISAGRYVHEPNQVPLPDHLNALKRLSLRLNRMNRIVFAKLTDSTYAIAHFHPYAIQNQSACQIQKQTGLAFFDRRHEWYKR